MLSRLRKQLFLSRYRLSSIPLRRYYDRLVQKVDDPAQSVGWQSAYSQQLRFLNLTLIGELQGSRVLDVGCGSGAFFQYLSEQGIDADYHGVDISPKMIEKAKGLYPEASFQRGDFLRTNFEEKYDYVVASGALSFKIPRQWQFIECFVEKMFSECKKGVAFNILSSRLQKQATQGRFFYAAPERVLKIALKVTPYVELRHHYLPNDFTVFMYRD